MQQTTEQVRFTGQKRKVVRAILKLSGGPFSPTMEEISVEAKVPLSTVRHHIEQLEKQKRIRRTPGKYRSLEVLDLSPEMVEARA